MENKYLGDEKISNVRRGTFDNNFKYVCIKNIQHTFELEFLH